MYNAINKIWQQVTLPTLLSFMYEINFFKFLRMSWTKHENSFHLECPRFAMRLSIFLFILLVYLLLEIC